MSQQPMSKAEILETECEDHEFSLYNDRALHGEFLNLQDARLGLFQECIREGFVPTSFAWYQGTDEGMQEGTYQFLHPTGWAKEIGAHPPIFLIAKRFTLP